MTGELAESIAADLERDLEERGSAMLILPGGSSPVGLIGELAPLPLAWDRVTITTTDERCVSVSDPSSNAGQAARLFAAKGVDINPVPLWKNGSVNEEETDRLPWPATVTVPGMGTDGHTASLFPGLDTPATAQRLVTARAPAPPYERVSMTFDSLLDSRRLILLLPGEEKQRLYQEISQGMHDKLPVAKLMRKAGGKLEAAFL